MKYCTTKPIHVMFKMAKYSYENIFIIMCTFLNFLMIKIILNFSQYFMKHFNSNLISFIINIALPWELGF